jgi:hypothetical protein
MLKIFEKVMQDLKQDMGLGKNLKSRIRIRKNPFVFTILLTTASIIIID